MAILREKVLSNQEVHEFLKPVQVLASLPENLLRGAACYPHCEQELARVAALDNWTTVPFSGAKMTLKIATANALNGGGTGYAAQYVRLLRTTFKGQRFKTCFEWCAGPGYIGFQLLAEGLVDRLVLADINPASVELVKKTIQLNSLANQVVVFESNNLDDIPHSQRGQWDIVVGNPPHFTERMMTRLDEMYGKGGRLRGIDSGWALHRRFYNDVGQFLTPAGFTAVLENALGSHASTFEAMLPPSMQYRGTIVADADPDDRTAYFFLADKRTSGSVASALDQATRAFAQGDEKAAFERRAKAEAHALGLH